LNETESKIFLIFKNHDEKMKENTLSSNLIKKTLSQDINKTIDLFTDRINQIFTSVKSLNNAVISQNNKIKNLESLINNEDLPQKISRRSSQKNDKSDFLTTDDKRKN
jgi:uncharacterized protein YoxC